MYLWKLQNFKAKNLDVANNIISNIKDSSFIEKIEIAGPGFINFYIKSQYYLDLL